MKYRDKKKLVNKLAEHFENYKGSWFWPKYVQFKECDEIRMNDVNWIHSEEAFTKVLEMLEEFEAGRPEEASRIYNKFTGVEKRDSIKDFYSFIKDYYL